MKILVTGAAGFIGFHLCKALLENGHQIVGVDNLNAYYDIKLKQGRLAVLAQYERFRFAHTDIADENALTTVANPEEIDVIVHLAAQAGVRYSIENPKAYVRSNLDGHMNVLEFARAAKGLKHLVYASSSSVYGDRTDGPFRETDRVRSPASLYAATKISDEVLSDSYVCLYKIPTTGLRFFTVYGAWGRPDMAYWIFTEKILKDEPITLFAAGEMSRDFTYIDDIVAGLQTIVKSPPQGDHPHEIYNLGNSTPTPLMDLVAAVENACGKRAKKIHLPKQPGDVNATFADITKAKTTFGYNPKTNLKDGIPVFVDWYRSFYNL